MIFGGSGATVAVRFPLWLLWGSIDQGVQVAESGLWVTSSNDA